MKIIYLLAVSFITTTCCYSNTQQKQSTVIIFNGPSATGKSSAQKELQALLGSLYLGVGIDSLLVALLPQAYISGQPADREQMWSSTITYDEAGNKLYNVQFGPLGMQVINGMNHAIAAYANQGNNLIVDYIAYDPNWLKELLHLLTNHKVYLVGFKLPIKVIEQREKLRATSPQGHARSHYQTIHEGISYHLEITDPNESAVSVAQKIYGLLDK